MAKGLLKCTRSTIYYSEIINADYNPKLVTYRNLINNEDGITFKIYSNSHIIHFCINSCSKKMSIMTEPTSFIKAVCVLKRRGL